MRSKQTSSARGAFKPGEAAENQRAAEAKEAKRAAERTLPALFESDPEAFWARVGEGCDDGAV
eukprot:COSAG01_NODE_18317_length_1085_cov_0.910751_2_plen_62_part_01